MRHLLARLCLFFTAILWPSPSACASDPPRVGDRTKLVVVLVVDQLRGDYLTRWSEHFEGRGFRLFLDEGAYFANAHFSYGATATAAGHATIVSGRLPRKHGVVANEWHWQGSKAIQKSATDPNVKLVGVDDAEKRVGLSPEVLIGAALGDELKLADRRSRVFSVGLKERSAIFMGGKHPDGAYWWDSKSGRWITSTYYRDSLPDYVSALNQPPFADRYLGQTWEKLLPESAYDGCYALRTAWLPQYLPIGATFPHALHAPSGKADERFYEAVAASPFGNDLVFEMAQRLATAEKLGQGPSCDLLLIALSSNDILGHLFGPESAEVLDFTVRTDRQLAKFFDWLDQSVGLGNCLVALSADHGVTSIGNVARQLRLGGGRVAIEAISKGLNEHLRSIVPNHPADAAIVGMPLPWVYVDRWVLDLPPADRSTLLSHAADFLRRQEGVARVFTADELGGAPPSSADGPLWRAWRCYHPQRSGALYIEVEPYWYPQAFELAGHAAGSSQDRFVPIGFFGRGVRSGRFFSPADPVDIAVTLSALLGIQAPFESDGRVLHEALIAHTR